MMATDLLADLERQGFTLTQRSGGKLVVRPSDRLTEVLRKTIRTNKNALLVALQQRQIPHLNVHEELIVPCDAKPKYRWWAGGQSIREILRELQAPQQVFRHYVDEYNPSSGENIENLGYKLAPGREADNAINDALL